VFEIDELLLKLSLDLVRATRSSNKKYSISNVTYLTALGCV